MRVILVTEQNKAYFINLQLTTINQSERTNNPGDKGYEHLTWLEIQITFRLKKRCSKSPIVKEKQIKPVRKITISIYQIDKDQNVW